MRRSNLDLETLIERMMREVVENTYEPSFGEGQFIDKESLAEIGLDDVTRFSAHLKQTVKPATHQRKLAAIHSLFRYAHQRLSLAKTQYICIFNNFARNSRNHHFLTPNSILAYRDR